ncbi:hypothetical protein CVIRNUC_000437 [Coccomyxa viridis]|uniref:Complex 1 LYR protein domain-containing protein n=1 Tax=Coccomyxa viridis TaxID=1274662 RepID=A0AAV1HQA4_9CHLO|nr:hypothetical protein CVIRNUC_000437 [Coccomyxa viridis]
MQIDKSHFTVKRLYKDCLRLADYIGTQGGNRAVLRAQIQQTFKKNAGETDPKKIEEQREAAFRGLTNYTFHEAQRMAKEQAPGNKGGFNQ